VVSKSFEFTGPALEAFSRGNVLEHLDGANDAAGFVFYGGDARAYRHAMTELVKKVGFNVTRLAAVSPSVQRTTRCAEGAAEIIHMLQKVAKAPLAKHFVAGEAGQTLGAISNT
jgi:hypothetical protein